MGGGVGREGVGREGVRGEREACGPSKFSVSRTSRDSLVDLRMSFHCLVLLQSR